MNEYDRERGLWNQIYAGCRPVDLRTIRLSVEPGFDGLLREFGE